MKTGSSRRPHLIAPTLQAETLIAVVALFLVVAANGAFWHGALEGRALGDVRTWVFVLGVGTLLTGLTFLVLAPFATRRTVRPLLATTVFVALIADRYMARYGIVLDASMLRNVLHTDLREASELVGSDILGTFVAAGAAAALVWRVSLPQRSLRAAARWRLTSIAAALLALAVSLPVVYQDFGSLMRTHRSLRYAINPASLVWSLGSVAMSDARALGTRRDPPEPVQRLQRTGGSKATLLVVVVGETARAANFSLNGYARATTPELAALDVINAGRADACGTATEVSLPCMFSPFGRAEYDEARIRRHESLLHVLSRAGYRVVWLDNQSGCKGVCDGLETRDLSRSSVPELCADGRCLDEILVRELHHVLDEGVRDTVVVLHQIGNHGPAYFRRYPPQLKRFSPACEKEELRECSREEIVNAYDNAIAYTDRFLAGVVRELGAARDRYDVAMVYASDHGESLGEYGLYLHGIPYAIAPREQLQVPMLWWLPGQTAVALGFDDGCFRGKATGPASHDQLYHTIMGMLGVKTPRYRPSRDLTADCRRPAA